MLFPDAGRPPSGAPAVASARGTINQENNRSPFPGRLQDRKSTRLNSSHGYISYAVFCLKKKKTQSTLSYSNQWSNAVSFYISCNFPVLPSTPPEPPRLTTMSVVPQVARNSVIGHIIEMH